MRASPAEASREGGQDMKQTQNPDDLFGTIIYVK